VFDFPLLANMLGTTIHYSEVSADVTLGFQLGVCWCMGLNAIKAIKATVTTDTSGPLLSAVSPKSGVMAGEEVLSAGRPGTAASMVRDPDRDQDGGLNGP
jgi:hypothetical protein